MKESTHEQTLEGKREMEAENPKQVPGFELLPQNSMQGSNSETMRSWPEPKSDA